MAILVSGLIVGTLDITAAIIQTLMANRSPVAMLKFIASGIFGTEAIKGDFQYAVYGLCFHYGIATGWSALLFLLYPKLKLLAKPRLVVGLWYGIFVWTMMNRVVLPLSNTPPLPFRLDLNLLKSMVVIIIAIGLPLSFLAHRYYKGIHGSN